MRRLNLDLVRRHSAWPAWPAWLLLAAGSLMLADALLDTQHQREEAQQQALRRTRAATPASASAPAPARKAAPDEATRREFDTAQQTLRELTLPWPPLFQAIEGALGPDIALLAIAPDAAKGVLQLNGEARHMPALLAFTTRLAQTRELTGIHLVNHQVLEDAAGRPLRFTLVAHWATAP